MAPPPPSAKLKGISPDLKKIIDANMDEAPARRRAREAFKGVQLSVDHCLFKVYKCSIEFEKLTEIYDLSVVLNFSVCVRLIERKIRVLMN